MSSNTDNKLKQFVACLSYYFTGGFRRHKVNCYRILSDAQHTTWKLAIWEAKIEFVSLI